MTANEFLKKLEEALCGQVSRSVLESNLRYYRGYIEYECRKGRREQDVLDELGDPRLIARTIVETQGASYSENVNEDGSREKEQRQVYSGERRTFSMDSWKILLIVVMVILVVCMVIGSVFGLLFRILLSPVFWIILAVLAFIRIVGGRRR